MGEALENISGRTRKLLGQPGTDELEGVLLGSGGVAVGKRGSDVNVK